MKKQLFLLALLLTSGIGPASFAELIEIGSQKQLFLDQYMIESMVYAKQVLNPALKASPNPVIFQDRPWEGNILHYMCVFYDESLGQFRMWYNSYSVEQETGKAGDEAVKETPSRLCYAVSKDGYHWEKPSLGWVDFEGSRENNILKAENCPPGLKGGIFIDRNEKDPAKRYKGMAQTAIEGNVPGQDKTDRILVWNLYYSPDAFNWTAYEGNPVIRPSGVPKVNPQGEPWAKTKGWQGYLWGPSYSLGWDPIRKVYAMFMENSQHKRSPMHMRIIGRAESPDLIHWTEPATIIIPDDLDPPDLQFYSMWATVYEGMYIGMLWNFRPDPPLHIWPQLVFSRDGIRFDRRYREPFILNSREPEFDSVAIYAQQPIIHDNTIFIYYHGVNSRMRQIDKIPGGPKGAMGLATVPLDGFVSIDDSEDIRPGTGLNGQALKPVLEAQKKRGLGRYGEVVTRPFTFTGNRLQINMAQARIWEGAEPCEVRVEILTPDHFRAAGYTFEDADPVTREGLTNIVSWKGKSDLSALTGKPVKLRFYLKNVKLFSFQFVE